MALTHVAKLLPVFSHETRYAFNVYAYNNDNDGDLSTTKYKTTLKTPVTPPSTKTVPGAVRSLTQESATSAYFRMIWSAPSSDGGSAITRYEHRYKRSSASSYGRVASVGTNRFLRVTPLRTNSLFNVQVRAVNAIGNGAMGILH